MVTHSILAMVEPGRLQKAVDGFVSGHYAVTVTCQEGEEIRGVVVNGDGHHYGEVLSEGQSFCSCPDAMYRKGICKHAVALALYVLRTPKTEAEPREQPVNLKLGKVRKGFTFSA